MNYAQALEILKAAKPDKVQKALQIARTHIDCFGVNGLQGLCVNLTASTVCAICIKYTAKINSMKEDKHVGRKSSKVKKAGSTKKTKSK